MPASTAILIRWRFSRVRAFESGLLALMRTKHTDLLDSIRKSGDLSDADATKLKGVVDGYARTFADGGIRSDREPFDMASPQGHARSHRRYQGDAEDHQGHADGCGLQAAPRAGGSRGRASLCRAHGESAGVDRLGGGRQRFGAEIAGRHRRRQSAAAGGLHRGTRDCAGLSIRRSCGWRAKRRMR